MHLTLPIYLEVNKKTVALSMNNYRNWHYFTSSKVKKQYSEVLSPCLEDMPALEPPIQLSYTLFYKNANSDLLNFGSLASKFLLDNLVAHNIIPNDTVKYVIKEEFTVASQDRENPRIEVLITSLKESDV